MEIDGDDPGIWEREQERIRQERIEASEFENGGDCVADRVNRVVPIASVKKTEKPFRSHSYNTAYRIIRDNYKNVLDGRFLKYNEMTGFPELSLSMVSDNDVSVIQNNIEERISTPARRDGEDRSVIVSREQISFALLQASSIDSYHPVRDYLTRLTWDYKPRLESVIGLLGAEDTKLSRAMFKKWAMSAVARVFSPGCKVDTVLILVGEQGIGKSKFFKLMGGEWFGDSKIDIDNKDAYIVLHKSWIHEWGELDVIKRAREMSSVKAFITSQSDTYRPPFGKFAIDKPRSGVFVGTTNQPDFLTDETGNRRFWPIKVTSIQHSKIEEMRDQLWAEARFLFELGNKWWLEHGEAESLKDVHEHHRQRDTWEERILAYVEQRAVAPGTYEILTQLLEVEPKAISPRDTQRVGAILRSNGYESKRLGGREDRSRKWVKQ